VDHTKFDQRYLENVAPIEALTGIITDLVPSQKTISQLHRSGVKLVTWQDAQTKIA